jgi:hypothetical protein
MVTRANRRFHLVKPPLLLFRCYLFVRGNQEKKPEKCRKARPTDWLSHRGDSVREAFRTGRLDKNRERLRFCKSAMMDSFVITSVNFPS